ncbi:DUF6747 family protein [Robertkochia solimangrovi]|uniref:DUF6747 family protein n=1 Tax=Robertkochia solimangrovi TaxID=2213046 RepID=UPI0018EFACC6|nr:DUF6747 family protein [Robertkochia solimangrovi]
MTTLLLIKEIYVDSFADLNNKYLVWLLKFMTWFCVSCLMMLFYAFTYRLVTGYEF